MDIETIDPEELRDAASRMLGDMVERRAPYDPGKSADRDGLYEAMVQQGWLLLTVPTDMDGLGQSFAALAPIYEELGKAIAPVVLAPSLATLELLAFNPTDALTELAENVAGGAARVAIAESGQVTVAESKLNGSLTGILADEGVTHILLLGSDGQAWIAELSGVSVDPQDSWDRSRVLYDITLEGVAAEPALSAPNEDAIGRVRAHLDLAIAWDNVGGTEKILEETLEYLRTRKQFDRAIGSFQALKHRAADHKVDLEVARGAARNATRAFADGDADAVTVAGQARLVTEMAYRYMVEDSVQLHGGIGFTWEHDCHLFLKRAILNELLYGRASERRDRLAPAVIQKLAEAMA